MARWLKDRYLYKDYRSVNAFSEWRLLEQLQRWRLPVPQPYAAAYKLSGVFYRADIIVRSCRPARPLSALLGEQPIAARHWCLIGQMLRRFHNKNVFHADLNAHNILLSPNRERAFLVDFDRSFIDTKKRAWRHANLKRLSRSLKKLKATTGDAFHYREDDFAALLDAYRRA